MDKERWKGLQKFFEQKLQLSPDQVYVRVANYKKPDNIITRLNECTTGATVGFIIYSVEDGLTSNEQEEKLEIAGRKCLRAITAGYDTVSLLSKNESDSVISNFRIYSREGSKIATRLSTLLPQAKTFQTKLPHSSPSVWIEMTSGERSNADNEWAFGQSLWSPSRAQDGNDRYALMREPKSGDLVLHLADGQFVGLSKVRESYIESASGPPEPGRWENAESYYRIPLFGFERFENSIPWQSLTETIKNDIKANEPQAYPFSIDKNGKLVAVQGLYLRRCTPTLFDAITKSAGRKVSSAPAEEPTRQPVYSVDEVAKATLYSPDEIDQWIKAINRKGQAIIYGPPGTGKTFVAKQLARHLVGGGTGIIDFVQLHPSYSYEDFIEGIRPQTIEDAKLTFPLVDGRLTRFCNRARGAGLSVLIIDEINRADLAKILGECVYALEYREEDVTLSSGKTFKVPVNVRLIGTMNTADRSIALVDHAIRRRFGFIELYPRYDLLSRFQEGKFDCTGLVKVLKNINEDIGERDFWLGTSYFMVDDLRDVIEDIWKVEIEPYLQEYFFDSADTVEKYRWKNKKNDIIGKAENNRSS